MDEVIAIGEGKDGVASCDSAIRAWAPSASARASNTRQVSAERIGSDVAGREHRAERDQGMWLPNGRRGDG